MSKSTINVRNLVLLLLFLFVLGGFVYKYYEWKILNELVSLNRDSVFEEISLDSDVNKLEVSYTPLIANFATRSADPKTTLTEITSNIDQIQNATSLLKNSYTNDLSIYRENQGIFTKVKNDSRFLVGKTGQYKNDFIALKEDYYKNSINVINENIDEANFLINLFTIWKDRSILNDFNKKAIQNIKANVLKYFSDLAPIEKYTDPNYKFINEDNIKISHPYGYDYLIKSKTYMGSYYSFTKDVYLGDMESAQYKASKLDQEGAELNFDFGKMMSERTDYWIKLNSNIVENLIKLFALNKKEKTNSYTSVYGKINNISDDLIMCGFYTSKLSLYKELISKYPSASSSGELIKELSTISPKSDQINSFYNKNIVNFAITDKSISTTCNDTENKKSFTFEVLK